MKVDRLLSASALVAMGVALAMPSTSFAQSAVTAPDAAAQLQPATPPAQQASPVPQSQAPLPADAAASTEPAEATGDIVVTGSLIRGVAPTGSDVISLSSQNIVASGASNTAQVLAKIPQISTSFNATPSAGSGPLNTIARPDIRRLNGVGGGGNTTLLLIDGHKIVGAGTTFETPDPDVIPPSALERVEVITDGGSSTYGADAVGGVINFITRRKFDGLEADARGGGASRYYTFDGSLTAGKSWEGGSAFVSYSYLQHDGLYGRDRSYVHSLVPQSGACYPGTVNAAGVSYLASTFTPGSSVCDAAAGSTIYPAEKRHSVFASFYQELSPALEVEIKGFFTRRDITTAQDPNFRNNVVSGATITSSNPFYHALPNDTGTQTVSFSFQNVADESGRTHIDEWGIVPTIKLNLGGGWQARLLGNYGRSYTSSYEFILTSSGASSALAGTTTATALDPYDLTKTNPAVFNNIFARNYQQSTQELLDTRLVVDGSLFSLPGGRIKVAVGGELTQNNISRGANASLPQSAYAIGDYSSLSRGRQTRNLASAFGELSLPILPSLTASAAVRYDHYDDFGSTTNPKFGVTFKPIGGVTFRGSYGTSFTAPALADTATTGSFIFARPNSPFVSPTAPAGSTARPTLFVLGGNPTLRPQTATTWSAGADFKPAFVPGLGLSLTYYNVSFKNQIGYVPFTNVSAAFQPYYSQYVIVNPTAAQIQNIAGQVESILGPFLAGQPNTVAGLLAASAANPPYAIIDTRKSNLGQLKVDGIDFNLTYSLPTSFGSLNASFAGTYTLKRDFAPAAGAAFVSQFDNPGTGRFFSIGSLGGQAGDLTGSLTWNHSSGYAIPTVIFAGNGVVGAATQSRIRAFDTIDFFAAYSLQKMGLKNTTITFNMNNIFDASPPLDLTNTDFGYGNGATLGRLIQMGISHKF